MARDEKPLQLRPVDDDVVETTPVIRLDNPETEWKAAQSEPTRLKPEVDEAESRRLPVPVREDVELRTHQPDIDVLIAAEAATPDQLEQAWGESAARRSPLPWGWFALIGTAILVAVFWSLARVGKADAQAGKIRVETRTSLVDEEKEERQASQLIDRIEKTVRDYFEATTVDALARYVRQPDRVVPLMREFYGTNQVVPAFMKSVKMLQPLTVDDRGNFWVASVVLADRTTKSLIIEIDPAGEPRIDWETLVCYQPMKWDDFVRKRPAGSSMDFRVYAEQDAFFSHEFSDSEKWLSFRLTALDSEETVFGYTPKNSPVAGDLLRVLRQNGDRRTTLILRLSIPEGLQSRRGVVIEKLLAVRWMYVDPPDSGS